MSYSDVLSTIQRCRLIVECINLSDCDKNSLLGKLSLYKDKVFKPDEILVIIADKSLPTTFDDQPPDIMPKMQEYIRYLNIPHNFILIVTNIDNMEQYLLQLQKTYYYHEESPIPFIYVQN